MTGNRNILHSRKKSFDEPELCQQDVKMAGQDTYHEAGRIVLLCIAWYFFSSSNNIVGKIILSDFPYPMTVSMIQLVSISIYLYPIIKIWSIPHSTQFPAKYWLTMIIPLAFGKFLASVSSHISILKVPVSYAHTGRLIT